MLVCQCHLHIARWTAMLAVIVAMEIPGQRPQTPVLWSCSVTVLAVPVSETPRTH
jgi:hypothetical protein